MKKFVNLFFLMPLCLAAQVNTGPCYSALRDTGNMYMNRKDYGEAITQFVAALVTCKDVPANNDLSSRIEEAKRKWANDLQASVVEAKKAFKEAVIAKEMAESAKTAEATARKLAEENAQNAYKRGVRAESFRLALLADMARQQGRKSDALLLSWLGIQMSDTLQPYLMRAFSEAVRDSFSTTFFSNPAQITELQYMAGGNFVFAKTAMNRFYILNPGSDASFVELSAAYTHVAPAPAGEHLLAWNSENVFVVSTEGKVLATIKGHTEPVVQALFSPDGRQVLTCSRDNTARVFDLSGNLQAVLAGHMGNVVGGAFSRDGQLLLTMSADGSSKVWDIDGKVLATLRDSTSFVTRAYFSAANLVYSQHSDGSIRVWAPDGKLKKAFRSAREKYWGLQQSADSDFFLVGIGGDKVKLMDSTGEDVATFKHISDVKGFAFSSDKNSILSWTADHIIWRWEIEGTQLMEYHGHRHAIQHADFNRQLNLLLSTGSDGEYKIWDAFGNLNAEWKGAGTKPANALFSPSLTKVLSVGPDGRSAMLTPMPKEIFSKMKIEKVLESQDLLRVKHAYEIQFLESLKGN